MNWVTNYARAFYSKALVWVVRLFVGLAFALQWLNASLLGIFLISLALYAYVYYTGAVDPFTGAELLAWSSELPSEIKVAVASAMLTIVGFLIAFQSATRNWKSQMIASVSLDASRDVHTTFTEAGKFITDVAIFAEQLLESSDEVQRASSLDEAAFAIDYVHDVLPEFLSARSRLKQMNVEVHYLIPRYSVIFASVQGSIADLDAAASALTAMTKHMWFQFPIVRSTEVDARARFLHAVDREKCEAFIQARNSNYDAMNALSGLVSGRLMKTLVRPNISFFRSTLRYVDTMPGILALRRKRHRKEPFRHSFHEAE